MSEGMGLCDIYFLIPGYFENASQIEQLQEIETEYWKVFSENIEKCIDVECNGSFKKSLQRIGLGTIKLNATVEYYDGCGERKKQILEQEGHLGIVVYNSKFCALEIMLLGCNVGGNKMLNAFCCGTIKYYFNDGRIGKTLEELCEYFNIKKCGKARSLIFVPEYTTNKEIVNALANEFQPMGNICGELAAIVPNKNIALYDTAEVYVSEETLVERCKDFPDEKEKRLLYHGIEIFFVEILLFQDAAIKKVFEELKIESERERSKAQYSDCDSETQIRLEEISFELYDALELGDYEKFKFITTRKSAYKIANAFGINFIMDKFRTSRELLESMIEINQKRIDERLDKVQNGLLKLISVLAAIGTGGEAFFNIFSDSVIGIKSYVLSSIIVVISFLLYYAIIGKKKAKKL